MASVLSGSTASWLPGAAVAMAAVCFATRQPRHRFGRRGSPTVLVAASGAEAPTTELDVTDKEQLLQAVAEDGWKLALAPADLQADPDVVRAAVASAACSLQFAAPCFRSDRELVMAAVARDGFALEYASEALQADREVVGRAVAESGFSLQFASEALRSDAAVVKAAVRSTPQALRHARGEALANREVVITAVSRSGSALEHADESLRADRAVVKKAVANHWIVLDRYAAPELRADPELVRLARRSKRRNEFRWWAVLSVGNLFQRWQRLAAWVASKRNSSETSAA